MAFFIQAFRPLLAALIACLIPCVSNGKSVGLFISQHPIDQNVCEGNRAVFSVEATADLPIEYDWQTSEDGVRWQSHKGSQAMFVLSEAAQMKQNGTQVRVALSAGSESLLSETARIFVENRVFFTKQPQNVAIVSGGSAVFVAEAKLGSGNGTPHFQWQFSDFGSAVWEDLKGENYQNLVLSNAVEELSNRYFRLAAHTLSGCDVAYSDIATLQVYKRPVVAVTPGTKTFCGGGNATFSVKMSGGTGKELIQWQISKDGGRRFENIKGATELFYMVLKITPEMTGWQYRARVKVPGDVEIFTLPAVVTVHGAVSFSEQPHDQTVCFGDSAVFKIKAEFRGKIPDYQWQISADGQEFKDIPNAIQTRLALMADSAILKGCYIRALVMAGGCQTITSESGHLVIAKEASFTKQPMDAVLASPEADAVFEADFEETGGNYNISWQWSANDGLTWMAVNNSSTKILRIVRPKTSDKDRLYRMKLMSKECGRIYYSAPAKIVFPSGQ